MVFTGYAELAFGSLEKAEKFKSEKGLNTIIFKYGEENPNKIPEVKRETDYRKCKDNMATLSYGFGKSRQSLTSRSMDSKY